MITIYAVKMIFSLLLVASGYGLGYSVANYKNHIKESTKRDVDDYWG